MQLKIGVFGFSGEASDEVKALANAVGKAVADAGGITITGATTGIPFEAAKGAKDAQGQVIGISPADGEEQHTKVFGMPLEYHDAIIYTGFGYIGRNAINVRTADACIIVNGSVGTLNELTAAFAHKRPIGILLGSGGVADQAEQIKKMVDDGRYETPMVFESDPETLVKKLLAQVKQ